MNLNDINNKYIKDRKSFDSMRANLVHQVIPTKKGNLKLYTNDYDKNYNFIRPLFVLPKSCLTTLDKNIDTLTFNKVTPIIRLFSNKYKDKLDNCNAAQYNVAENSIYYVCEKDTSHEVLHCASNNSVIPKFGPTIHQVGFCFAYNINFKIGVGLNEGYTVLLDEKLFHNTRNKYSYLVELAEIIENIIGKETMMKYYFNSNLTELIKNLSNRLGKETTLNIIFAMDIMRKNRLLRSKYYKVIINELEEKLSNSRNLVKILTK